MWETSAWFFSNPNSKPPVLEKKCSIEMRRWLVVVVVEQQKQVQFEIYKQVGSESRILHYKI